MPVYTLSDSSSGSFVKANGEHLTAVDAAQDNPVGATKSIYVIRNIINDKVYVGQSNDPVKRFSQHVQEARRNNKNSALHGAIRKYGADCFYMQVLEADVEDYNDRESYWIAFFDSITPNGYNIQSGGEDPPVRKGLQNNKSKFTEADIEEIYILLKNPALSMLDIANRFHVSQKTISSINRGATYRADGVSYPIRDLCCCYKIHNMIREDTVKEIIDILKSTDISMRKIALKYGVSHHAIISINDGTAHIYHMDDISYPIRTDSVRPSEEQVDRIKELLIHGNMSKRHIALEVGVSYAVVTSINRGASYFDENLVYPLKNTNADMIMERTYLNEFVKIFILD